MKDTPEDIQKEAWRVYGTFKTAWMKAMMEDHAWDDAEQVARAILAERQRCADTARRYLEDIAGCDMNDDEPDKIAAAVMDPKWEPPSL